MLLQKHAALLAGAVMPQRIPQVVVVAIAQRGAQMPNVLLAGKCPRNNGNSSACLNGAYTCKHYLVHNTNIYGVTNIQCRK